MRRSFDFITLLCSIDPAALSRGVSIYRVMLTSVVNEKSLSVKQRLRLCLDGAGAEVSLALLKNFRSSWTKTTLKIKLKFGRAATRISAAPGSLAGEATVPFARGA
jgi:hypothetical protein